MTLNNQQWELLYEVFSSRTLNHAPEGERSKVMMGFMGRWDGVVGC